MRRSPVRRDRWSYRGWLIFRQPESQGGPWVAYYRGRDVLGGEDRVLTRCRFPNHAVERIDKFEGRPVVSDTLSPVEEGQS